MPRRKRGRTDRSRSRGADARSHHRSVAPVHLPCPRSWSQASPREWEEAAGLQDHASAVHTPAGPLQRAETVEVQQRHSCFHPNGRHDRIAQRVSTRLAPSPPPIARHAPVRAAQRYNNRMVVGGGRPGAPVGVGARSPGALRSIPAGRCGGFAASSSTVSRGRRWTRSPWPGSLECGTRETSAASR